MSGRIRRWMVGAFLLGAMACLGAPTTQAQYPNYPQDRRYPDDQRNNDRYERDRREGTRGGYWADEQRLRFLEQQIRRDKDEVRADSRRFGKNSFQARTAKERLKRDERELKQLKKDMKRDRKLNQRRDDRGRYPY